MLIQKVLRTLGLGRRDKVKADSCLYGEMRKEVEAALRGVPPAERQDTYVISFYLHMECQGPMKPELIVGTNTNKRVNQEYDPSSADRMAEWSAGLEAKMAARKPGEPLPGFRELLQGTGSLDEAKWNYACHQHNDLVGFGRASHPSHRVVRDWLDANGLTYPDHLLKTEAGLEQCERIDQEVFQRFAQCAATVAISLHNDGVVQELFGRSIPIILYDLGNEPWSANLASKINPPGVADEFVRWAQYEDD